MWTNAKSRTSVKIACTQKKYLSGIESPQIRSIFTKLRIYINSTWDSNVRSFRYKNVQSNQCTYCKSTQYAEHLLIIVVIIIEKYL